MTGSILGRCLLPSSVAIIMDGNRRWAERRGVSTELGHMQGAKTAEHIMRYAHELGIKYLTLFAFSSENWQRPPQEIDAIMNLMEGYLKHDTDELIKNGIRIIAIGELERLPRHLMTRIKEATKKTERCSKFFLTLAISYGGQAEIKYACKEIANKVQKGHLALGDITEDAINEHLFTKEIPHPDLYIRTSGELRLSNFLLFQASYSELYFTSTLWPDFQPKDLDLAILSFSQRKRRFGAHQRN